MRDLTEMTGAGAAAPLLLFLAGCTATTPMLPTPTVVAAGETEPVGTGNEDAADDPAIWRNDADPSASLIVATDKKAGLYVYGLDGKVRDFDAGGALNNVDLVDMDTDGVIVFASDRGDKTQARFRLYRLDTEAAKLEPLGTVPAGTGEAYGICGWRSEGRLIVYSVLKEGTIEERQVLLGDAPSSSLLRTLSVASQPEGCAIDTRNGNLYIGEEDVGIWRFAAGAATGELVARVDNIHLVADVEGLALVPEGTDGGWLFASSQGDNAYMRYRLPDMTPAGRFRIAEGAYGGTQETDGIEARKGDFGPAFPGGLFIAQDGMNAPRAQNFKLVPLVDIEAALAEN